MDSYYVNLLSAENDGINWEDSPECTPIEEQLPVEPVISSTKPTSKRSKNFNEKEDMVLVSAWLNISLDVAQGNEQSRATYWRRIHAYFHGNRNFESDRTQSSLVHRWSTIQEHVNKFYGCHDRIERRRQSGVIEKDKIIQACALYKEEEQKSFMFLHCWNVLQHHPKWTDRLSQKKQKVSMNSTPATSSPANSFAGHVDSTGDAPSAEDSSLKRPIGKKAAKTRLRRGQGSCSSDGSEKVYMEALDTIWCRKSEADGARDLKKDERYERAYALEQERIATEKEKLQLKKQEFELRKMVEEEKIMKIDTSTMEGPLKQYYMSLQTDIIARRCGGSI